MAVSQKFVNLGDFASHTTLFASHTRVCSRMQLNFPCFQGADVIR